MRYCSLWGVSGSGDGAAASYSSSSSSSSNIFVDQTFSHFGEGVEKKQKQNIGSLVYFPANFIAGSPEELKYLWS